MQSFQLTIVAYNRIVFDGAAVLCRVATPHGLIGLEAHHETFMAVLREDSEVSYQDADGKSGSVKVKNGMLSFENNTCTVTVVPSGS